MTDKELIAGAKRALENAYAPYSVFHVGACVLCDDGRAFTGCNVENASYGAAICAERTAIVKAVSEGAKRIMKIAVVSDGGRLTPPCGICLQVLSEFMDQAGEVLLQNETGEIIKYQLGELLPLGFHLEDTGEKERE